MVERVPTARAPAVQPPRPSVNSVAAIRGASSRDPTTDVVLLTDVLLAEHKTDTASRLDLGRNRILGEQVTASAMSTWRRRGCRISSTQITSIGLYSDGRSVLRVVRNAEPNTGRFYTYDDTAWAVDHDVEVIARVASGAPVNPEPLLPGGFWVSASIAADPELIQVLRTVYRQLDAGERLHPRGVRLSRVTSQVISEATRLAPRLAATTAMVTLVRGRERPNPAAAWNFLKDMFRDARYEVGGALTSVFVVDLTDGSVRAWSSAIGRDTSATNVGNIVRRLIGDLPLEGTCRT
jgi:hypothetical protein